MSVISELFEAIQTGDAANVQELLAHDPALANAQDDSGIRALLMAVYYRRQEIADLLIAAGAEIDMFVASAQDNVGRIEELLNADQQLVGAYSADGRTPLHLAAHFNCVAAARALIARGADVHAHSKNHMHNTPLQAAVDGAASGVVQLLLDHGANVNDTQESGWTALHSAAQSGDLAIARLLLAHGADVNATQESLLTPLAIARASDHDEMAELLRQHGAAEGIARG